MTLNLDSLSAQQLRKAAALREKIDALQTKLNALLGAPAGAKKEKAAAPKAAGKAPVKRKRRLSKSARAKMAAALKARWAKAKASGKKSL